MKKFRRNIWRHPARAVFVLGATYAFGGLGAEGFRVGAFQHFKEIKPPSAKDRSVYGRLRLDEDLVRYAGVNDVVPTAGGSALPFLRRAVPADRGQTGTARPRVIFSQKKRGDRFVYNLELPPPPTGTEYVWLSLQRSGVYEAGVTLSLGAKAGEWESAGFRNVFRYRGSSDSRIRFRGGSNRFLRLEFQGEANFTFPQAGYEPVRRVSEFKADIARTDFKESLVSETSESVFHLENEKHRKIHRLILRFREERFRRKLRIEAMEGAERSYSQVMSTTLYRGKGEGADQVIDLRSPVSGALKLTLENGDNKPLTLQDAEAYSPLEEIVFELPQASGRQDLRVYYGNRYASPLEFDLRTTFDPSLASVRVEAGPHQKNTAFAYSFVEPPISTWVIRVLFYFGLLGVLFPAYRVFSRYAEHTKVPEGQASTGG